MLLAIGLLAAELQAAPLLRCQVEQNGTASVFEFVPVADPYSVAPIDINGYFRFQAVLVGDPWQVEYVKIYVYAVDRRRVTMLHQASYLKPVVDRDIPALTLTGRNHVYAPGLERELAYDCMLLAPPK